MAQYLLPFFHISSVNILTRLLNTDTTFDKKKREKRKRNSTDPLASFCRVSFQSRFIYIIFTANLLINHNLSH